jgi:hypothetical protein
MASAGIAALLCLYVAIPNPRLTLKLLAVAAAAVAMLVTPLGAWGRFDPAWLRLVMDRSPYLFLSTWQIDNWSRAAVTLATLSVGLVAADVFWPESPVAAWLLLDRPNCLSVLQTSGMVFSRDTAMEVQRRAP